MPDGWLLDLEHNALALGIIIVLAFGVNRLLAWIYRKRFLEDKSRSRFAYPLIQTLLGLVTLVAVILALPFEDTLRGQLLQFLGLAITAVVALSASTVAANAMSGMMLRAMRSFRTGDYLKVGDAFGRVTELGLFHTEIQTEARELTTIPNQVIIGQPTTVIHASGTLVSSEVSLGYDLPHEDVREKLLEAATAAGLSEPFVHILALQDFTVLYRVSGLLAEVKKLLTVRSLLNESILATLHTAGMEIASPTLMVTRALQRDESILPRGQRAKRHRYAVAVDAEALMFEKADLATQVETLDAEHADLNAEVALLAKHLAKLEGAERELEEKRLARLQRRLVLRERRRETLAHTQEKE